MCQAGLSKYLLKRLEALLSILHRVTRETLLLLLNQRLSNLIVMVNQRFYIIIQSTTEQSYYYGSTIPISNVASSINDSTS